MGYLGCLLLWNPTTRMHTKLPNPRPRWKYYYDFYGFGYDEVRDDYNVVGIFFIYQVVHMGVRSKYII